MNIEKLKKLASLRDSGILSEEEFQLEKQKVMSKKEGFSLEDKKFGLSDTSYNSLLHLSQFCSFLLPVLGIAAPIVLWILNKDDDPIVDQHGRNVINWNISVLIYLMVSFLLMFALIGFVLILIPITLSIVFPIIGALNAKKGKIWKYPLTLTFI